MATKVRTMSLYPRNMEKIISGTKTVEIRVEYPNYRTIAANQLLRFMDSDRSCLTRIVRVSRYPSFDAMLDVEDPVAIGYEPGLSKEAMLERVRRIYTPTKEALGVLAIEVSRVDDEGSAA